LTLAVDVNSRCILGYHLSYDPPSYLSVSKCLRHAFLPKTGLKKKYPEIVNDWLPHGVMHQLVVDNGLEFHSEALETACQSLGIEMHFAPRKTPWFKPHVERMFRTLQDSLVHQMPGTTFSNTFLRGEYDSQKHAVITRTALDKMLCKWVVDVYHQSIHRGLQARPIDIWRTRIAPEDILLPEDPALLDAILGKSFQRRLRHDGIAHNKLHYNSVEMRKLREQYGEALDVEIKVDESDLGSIVVLSPDKTKRFTVRAVNYDYACGLSLWQHNVICRYAKEFLNGIDETELILAKEAIREMIEAEMRLTKRKKSRAKAARFMDQVKVPETALPEATAAVTGNSDHLTETASTVSNNSDVLARKKFIVEIVNRK